VLHKLSSLRLCWSAHYRRRCDDLAALFLRNVNGMDQFKRSSPTATKSTYIDTPNDRKTHYRLDLQIEHANESGT
jgi:hypothetical protein